jgi:hypothetical protein
VVIYIPTSPAKSQYKVPKLVRSALVDLVNSHNFRPSVTLGEMLLLGELAGGLWPVVSGSSPVVPLDTRFLVSPQKDLGP